MSKFACCFRAVSLAAVLITALSLPGFSATLCVNRGGTSGCYSSILAAVTAASPGDVVQVGPGTYTEGVVIGISLSLIGAGADKTAIDATGQPNGVLVDGFNNPGLQGVMVSGFTVKNALYEGILAVSSTNVAIRNNNVVDNDAIGPVFTGAPMGCKGQPNAT